ncbi:MAG: ABC transporter permease [Nitrospirae bacterium]|nr:ABC transporter permease [Nitrospirota bacterium]
MIILRYALKTAFNSIWREKWINFLTVLSVSIGLSILCSFVMVSRNTDSVVQRWAKSFGMVVYLDKKVDPGREESLKQHFQRDTDIVEVKYISRDKALDEVKHTLGSDALILEGLDENPLPASLELTLKSDLLDPALAGKKAAHIKQMQGVEEVQYGEKWLSSLYAISKAMKVGTLFFGCAVFAAITFITFSTIKIFFYRRKDEIETLKLLGATKIFIRLPFLIEGIFIGLIGGIISVALISAASSFASLKIVEFMPSMKSNLTSLPLSAYIEIPLAGAFLSVAGSFIAVGKIKY